MPEIGPVVPVDSRHQGHIPGGRADARSLVISLEHRVIVALEVGDRSRSYLIPPVSEEEIRAVRTEISRGVKISRRHLVRQGPVVHRRRRDFLGLPGKLQGALSRRNGVEPVAQEVRGVHEVVVSPVIQATFSRRKEIDIRVRRVLEVEVGSKIQVAVTRWKQVLTRPILPRQRVVLLPVLLDQGYLVILGEISRVDRLTVLRDLVLVVARNAQEALACGLSEDRVIPKLALAGEKFLARETRRMDRFTLQWELVLVVVLDGREALASRPPELGELRNSRELLSRAIQRTLLGELPLTREVRRVDRLAVPRELVLVVALDGWEALPGSQGIEGQVSLRGRLRSQVVGDLCAHLVDLEQPLVDGRPLLRGDHGALQGAHVPEPVLAGGQVRGARVVHGRRSLPEPVRREALPVLAELRRLLRTLEDQLLGREVQRLLDLVQTRRLDRRVPLRAVRPRLVQVLPVLLNQVLVLGTRNDTRLRVP